jgi:predicted solute-binding protein
LQPKEHRAVLLLIVAVEIEIREDCGVLIHEKMEIEEGLHAPSSLMSMWNTGTQFPAINLVNMTKVSLTLGIGDPVA